MDYLKQSLSKNNKMEITSNNLVFFNFILSIITTLLWGIYVYYTRKTFKEMSKQTRELQKQTDYQTRAFIITTPINQETDENCIIMGEIMNLHNKWKKILEANTNYELTTKVGLFALKLKNRGRSDVVKWELKVKATIDPGEFLKEKYNINGEKIEFIIESNSSEEHIIPADRELIIPISPISFFPKCTFRWELRYIDIRNQEYRYITDDNNYSLYNRIVFDLKPDAEI